MKEKEKPNSLKYMQKKKITKIISTLREIKYGNKLIAIPHTQR